jgi:hypothetical protein
MMCLTIYGSSSTQSSGSSMSGITKRLTSLTRSSLPSSSRTCFQAHTVTLRRKQLGVPQHVAWSSRGIVTLLYVEEYSEWQMSRVKRDDLREGVQRIRDIALKEGLDLVQIHEDQDPDYSIKDSVQAGVAKRSVREIPDWAERYKGNDGSDVPLGPGVLED